MPFQQRSGLWFLGQGCLLLGISSSDRGGRFGHNNGLDKIWRIGPMVVSLFRKGRTFSCILIEHLIQMEREFDCE